MLGLIAALAGVAAVDLLGWQWADGAASVVIAFILATVAALLAYETKGLLIGEAASREVVQGVRRIVTSVGDIRAINELRTLHLAPNEILLAISVDFVDGISSEQIEAATGKLEREIKHQYPEVRRLFIEVQSSRDHARDERTAQKSEA